MSNLVVGGDVYDIAFTGNVSFNTQFGSDPVPATPPLYFGATTATSAISDAATALLNTRQFSAVPPDSLGASDSDSNTRAMFPVSSTATAHDGFDVRYEGEGEWAGGASYSSFSRSTSGIFALATLLNPPTVTLSVDNVTIPESGGVATLTATLSRAASLGTTVELGFTGSAINIDDYTRSSTQIVIAPGETTGTVTIAASHDTLDETDETVIVDIVGATNATESSTQQQTITILDDDDPSAGVTGTVFNGGQANRSGIAAVTMQFSDTVTVTGPEALLLWNYTTGAAVSSASATLSGNGTNAITWDMTGVALPPGYYTATLSKSEGLAATHSELFSVQPGDSDGDRAVGFSDFGQLASNFNATGPPYFPGDMDGDGTVGFGDFGILATNFNAALVAPSQDTGDAGGSYPAAQHLIGSGLALGANISGADDGVTFGTLQTGNNAALITVSATIPSGGNGSLNAWIDFNNDGDWDDVAEQVFIDQALSNGDNSLTAAIPAGAAAGTAQARFRVSRIDGYGPGGLAANGEVEDYQVTVVAAKGNASRRGPAATLDLGPAVFVAQPVSPQTTSVGTPGQVGETRRLGVEPKYTDIVDLAVAELAATVPSERGTSDASASLDEDLADPVFAEQTDLRWLDLGVLR